MRRATSFVGREADVATLRQRLTDERLVTVVGLGGLGKSRLASELSLRVADDWNDGVWLVDLSVVSDDLQVTPSVAAALGIGVSVDDADYDVAAALRDRRLLLVLDGCDRVLDAAATLAEELLRTCPNVTILATSQEPLDLPAEAVYRLTPLSLDDDAVELFVDRARRHGATPDRDVARQIVSRLDGVPLALELAASRAAVMSSADLLAGLDRRFQLLRATSRGLPARQRTMLGLLDWSTEVLEPAERMAFERLSIFAAPFDIAAATAALADDDLPADDVALHIWSLTDKSLVVLETSDDGTRYRMFETVRAYAAERLRAHGGDVAPRAALAAWYVDRFPMRRRGDPAWISALAVEIDILSGLIDEMAPSDDELPALARLRGEIRTVRAEHRTGVEEIDHVLARRTTWTPAWVRLELFAASLLGELGEVDAAFARCDRAEPHLDGDRAADRWGPVSVASPRALLLLRIGDVDAARRTALVSLDVAGDHDRASSLFSLALIAQTADGAETLELYREATELARAADDHVLIALAMNNSAECKLRTGELGEAAALQRESLALAAELGMKHIAAFGLIVAARMAEQTGDDERAVRLHARADVILAETGIRLFDDDLALSDGMRERARQRIGGAAYEREVEVGRALDLAVALEEADETFRAVEASAAVVTDAGSRQA